MKPNLIRNDGTYWASSYNPDAPMIGLFVPSRRYYFRQVERKWRFFWRPTGEVWEGGDFREAGFRTLAEMKSGAAQ